MKPHIALICGGKSAEHEISCLSALGIFDAIDREKYRVSLFGITASGRGFIEFEGVDQFDRDVNGLPLVPELEHSDPRVKPLPADLDLIFPVLHGSNGEDGVFQGYAEFLQINYLGSGVLASALAMDKARAKEIFAAAGLKVAEAARLRSVDEITDHQFSFPVFVKPSRGGSSRGTTKVKDVNGLAVAVREALRFDDVALVEQAIVGREIECAILQVDGQIRASVVGEIRVLGDREFYDYEAKYLDNATEYLVPAPVAESVASVIQSQAIHAFKAIGCEGLARVDFFLGDDGAIVINELNTMPGFTPKSVFPMLWRASGLEYRAVIATMIDEALKHPKI